MVLPEYPPGHRIGKYRLGPILGRGGMGAVYEALDLHLRRPVAIKLLPADANEFPRLLREARAAARVSHANVVATYDVGREGPVFFIVMELVRGTTAQGLVAGRGPLPWVEATTLVAAVCRGLYAAHLAGLIHRDIKPANILCPDDGDPKLADFGLAKPALTETQLTHRNTLLGTPEYMSPEQCRGEQLDARTDIYSLGATYYFLLTGRLPFAAPDRAGVMFAHCTAPPPDPRDLNPDVSSGCAAVVERALAKKRADRYPDCKAMTAALADTLKGTGIDMPALTPAVLGDLLPEQTPTDIWPLPDEEPAAAPDPKRRRLVLAGLGVVGVGVVGGVLLTRDWGRGSSESGSTPGGPANANPMSADELVREWVLPAVAGRTLWPAPEPYWFATAGGTGVPPLAFWDGSRSPRLIGVGSRVTATVDGGRWFATATADRKVSIYLPSGTTPVGRADLSGPATALAAHGRWIAAATGTAIELFDLSDPTAPVAVSPAMPPSPGVTALAFGSDGTYLAGLTAANAVEVWEVEGRRMKGRGTLNGTELKSLAFGPAPGQLFVFGRRNGRAVFYIWDPVGSGPPRELPGPPTVTAAAPFRDRKMILVAGGEWLAVFDAFGGRGARPITDKLSRSSVVRTVVAAPGRRYAIGYEDGSVEVWAAR